MKRDIIQITKEIEQLRIVLIVFTPIQIAYFILLVTTPPPTETTGYSNPMILFTVLQFAVVGLFIWYIHAKMPTSEKSKTNSTLMIFFLGIIGMWLWIPSKAELRKLAGEEYPVLKHSVGSFRYTIEPQFPKATYHIYRYDPDGKITHDYVKDSKEDAIQFCSERF